MAFNSAEYSWADLQLVTSGRKITGARAVKFKTMQDKEVIRAAGNEPRGFGYGDKSYEGELTLLQSEVEALLEAAGAGNDITDIHGTNIIVAFVPKLGGRIKTHIIEYVEFGEFEMALKTNDKFMEVNLPFKALKISYNV